MPTDFTHDLHEESSFSTPADADLKVVGVAIPPEVLAPKIVPPPDLPVAPSDPAFEAISSAPKPKRKKGWLVFLALLAIGGGIFASGQLDSTSRSTSSAPRRVKVSALASKQSSQLKTLWQAGARAKKRGNYALARRLWTQGLKLDPGNRGFRESLAKLPKNSRREIPDSPTFPDSPSAGY